MKTTIKKYTPTKNELTAILVLFAVLILVCAGESIVNLVLTFLLK